MGRFVSLQQKFLWVTTCFSEAQAAPTRWKIQNRSCCSSAEHSRQSVSSLEIKKQMSLVLMSGKSCRCQLKMLLHARDLLLNHIFFAHTFQETGCQVKNTWFIYVFIWELLLALWQKIAWPFIFQWCVIAGLVRDKDNNMASWHATCCMWH